MRLARPAVYEAVPFRTCVPADRIASSTARTFQPPPRLGPQWSTWIVIVATLFLIAVSTFYFYAR
jgi:hypothetical protein